MPEKAADLGLESHTGTYDWDEALRQCEQHFGQAPYEVPAYIRNRVF